MDELPRRHQLASAAGTNMESTQPASQDALATQWSLIDAVAAGDRLALDRFLERYLPAFRNYLVRTLRRDHEDVDDLLQQFLQEKLLEQNLVARVNRDVGFRKFVYRSLKNFVTDQFRRERRRTEGQISLDEDHHEHLATTDSDADLFDVAWADFVLREALQRVRRECFARQQERIWEIFESRVLQPLREGIPPASYEELQQQFQFDSPIQAANALETAKRKLRLHLQEVIAEYAGRDSTLIDGELIDLRNALAHASCRPMAAVPDVSSGHSSSEESFLGTSDAPQRMSRVLELAQLDSPLWLPDEAADILREELQSPITAACDDAEFLRELHARDRSTTPIPPNLRTLFAMDVPPLWLLELVKRWSKSLLRIAQPPIPKEVAYVLHSSCICAGIRAGSRSITRSSDAEMLVSLKLLLGYSWIDPELRRLFEQTREALEA